MRKETFIGLAIVAGLWGFCDDAGRAAGRYADNLDDGSRWYDDVSGLIRGSDDYARVPLAARIPQIADEFAVPPELKEAWDGLVWDVGCDLALGQVPETVEELDDYILERGLAFGLDVFDDAAAQLAEKLIGAVNQDPFSRSDDLCNTIEQSLESI